MSIRNRGGSDPQAADFIQDVNRFQLPSEEVADEMGEEAAAFICGLIREEQAAQTVDLHLASQQQRPDRSERYGDGVPAPGCADVAGQTAFGGVETVGRLFYDRRLAGNAAVQNRVIS